jgi:acyl dehydratase|tara:strand:+ start:263 stop:760 length:498 start_codon:yes stop_codon:yes gene_type:complete
MPILPKLENKIMSNFVSTDQLVGYIGKEVGLTDWFEVDQERINNFAEATGDFQYIHVDEERAAETPFGATIAHGFLTLSLLSKLSSMSGGIKLENSVMGINYGLNKVRFLNPVKVNSKIRARFELISAEEKKPNHYLLKHNVTVEIEGEEKPALIAEWLGMSVLA